MRAQPGDRIILAADRVDLPTREGRIVEVRGEDGGPPYSVAWSDGHTGLLYPGPGAVLQIADADAPDRPEAQASGRSAPSRQWDIHVSVHCDGDDTRATAVLVGDADQLSATGESHRSSRDEPVPRIGDEVAVARALRHLADKLMAAAEADVSDRTGEDAHIRHA